MVFLKKWPFFQNFFFLSKIGEENVFYDILEQKWPFFPTFFFRQYRPGKCLLQYSRRRKRLSRLKKNDVEKSRKIDIFPKGLPHGFGPKMAIIPSFF